MTLTLQTILDHSLCASDWDSLNKAIGGDLKTEISIGDVLLNNGLAEAMWCLQCVEPRKRVEAIMPAVKRAAVHTTDQRVHDCIAAIDQWLTGDDTVDLNAASQAAAQAEHAASEQAADAAFSSWIAKDAEYEGTAWAAWASWVSADAARSARAAAELIVDAAATWATRAAAALGVDAAERKRQEADLLAMFPPIILKGELA